MLLSLHYQENLCGSAIYIIFGIGAMLFLVFGGSRLYNKKGLISSLLFLAGVLIGFIIPINEIVIWIFFLGRRGDLPFSQILIGLALIMASVLFRFKNKQGEEDKSQNEINKDT